MVTQTKDSDSQSVVIFLSSWLAFVILTFPMNYFEVYLPNETTLFGDLKSILWCGGFEFDDNPQDDCSLFIYGTVLLETMLRLGSLHAYGDQIIYLIVVLGLSSFAWIFTRANSWSSRFFIIFVFMSPPIALLIQRANLDLLIFAITVLALELFRRKLMVLAIILVSISTLMKLYTLPLALFLCLIVTIHSKGVPKKAFLSIFAVILALWTLYDASQIPWLPSDARNSFGLPIFGEYLQFALYGPGSQSSRWTANLIGGSILAVLVTILHWHQEKIGRSLLKKFNLELLSWMLLFLGIFLAGISIDYRLVFLIPIVVSLLQFAPKARIWTAVLIGPVYIFSYPFENLQIVGDVALFLLVSFIITLLFQILPIQRGGPSFPQRVFNQLKRLQ
jgi:hypothetical protein